MKPVFLLLLVCFSTCSFAQIRKQRLIAQSTYLNADTAGCCTFILHDSTTYKYSGPRHSKTDFISLNWMDFMSIVQGGAYPPIRLVNGIVKPNNIDSLQYARIADFDTAAYYEADSTGKAVRKDLETCDYYSDGKLRHANGLGFDMDYLYSFGALNRTRQVYQRGQDTSWDIYLNDAFGNVVMDYYGRYYTPGIFSSSWAVQFEFDSLSRYTSHAELDGSASWFPDYRNYYAYYPDGKVKTITNGNVSFPDSTYLPDVTDSFGYTPGVPGYTSRSFFRVWNHQMLFSDRTHVNSRGLVDTLVRTNWVQNYYDVFIIEYNSAGNPVTCTKGNERDNYYYEEYNDALATNEPPKTALPITLFPNPASSTLTLRNLPNSPVSIRIINVMGQLVQTERITPQGISTNISLSSALPPGIYQLQAVNGSGAPVYLKFVKQ